MAFHYTTVGISHSMIITSFYHQQPNTTNCSTINYSSSMATLSKFPCFLSLSPHKLFLNQHPEQECQLCLMMTHDFAPRKCFRIYACSAKKSRRSRKVKSNVELCNDIREFVSTVGLPEGYLPLLKEFSDHGRTDLANIVRRRGYKLIRELLSNRPIGEVNSLNEENSLAEGQNAISSVASLPTGQGGKAKDIPIYSMQSSEVSMAADHSADEVKSIVEDSSLVAPSYNVKENDEVVEHMIERSSPSMPSCEEANSLTSSLLEEKVENFIQNGDLDVVEDGINGILHENSTDEAGGAERAIAGTNAASTLNGRSIVASKQVTSPVTVNQTLRSDQVSAESQASDDFDKDLDVETSKMENQVETNQLKLMLHQKELELSRLKDRIEKEKLALATLQEKAEAEINRAQKLISEKDAELHSAEETLSGLVEVKIQYSGDGETVEVAGSFNGWHHPIKMEPQSSASSGDPDGSRTGDGFTHFNDMILRKSRVWSTMLWLYPGAYEIKFIVDGHWKIDPQREKVTRGGISNNILRVDR